MRRFGLHAKGRGPRQGDSGQPREGEPSELNHHILRSVDLNGVLGRPLMARIGSQGHIAGTSALPPTTDLRVSMSVFTPISSASPPGADLPGGVAEGPFLTQTVSKRRRSVRNVISAHSLKFRC